MDFLHDKLWIMFHGVLNFGRPYHLKSCKFMAVHGIWPLDEKQGTLTITWSQPLARVQVGLYYQLVVHCNTTIIFIAMLRNTRQHPSTILLVSQLQQGSRALTLCIPPMRMVSFPYLGPPSHGWVTKPPTHACGTLPLNDSQLLDVDFHPWKSNLQLIIAFMEQHYNNPKHIWQLNPHVGPTHVQVVPFGLEWFRATTHICRFTHIRLQDFEQGPYPPSNNLLSLS